MIDKTVKIVGYLNSGKNVYFWFHLYCCRFSCLFYLLRNKFTVARQVKMCRGHLLEKVMGGSDTFKVPFFEFFCPL